jgi:hypothetical protein
MKRKSIIISAIGISMLALATYLFLNLNAIVIRTTEDIASDALGVQVHIGDIDISLSDKTVNVKNIRVDNPKKYKGRYILETENIEIGLNSVSGELIDFKDIKVGGSVVHLEANENGLNLVDLKRLANQKQKKETTGSDEINVIVKKMVIGASTVESRITFLDKDIANFKVPAVYFSNMGRGNGIAAGDAISQVIIKYVTAVEAHARKNGALSGVSLPGVDDVKKTLDGAVDSLKSLF